MNIKNKWHKEASKNISNTICQGCYRLYVGIVDKRRFDHHCISHDYDNGECRVLCPKCHGRACKVCKDTERYLGLVYKNPLGLGRTISRILGLSSYSDGQFEFEDMYGNLLLGSYDRFLQYEGDIEYDIAERIEGIKNWNIEVEDEY